MKIIFGFFVFVFLVNQATAEENGKYLLAGLGKNTITDQGSNYQSLGLNLGAGYTFVRYVGVESEMSSFGLIGNGSARVFPFSISAVGHLPITSSTGLFAKIGRAETFVSYGPSSGSMCSGLVGTSGFGLEFGPNSKKVLRLGVDRYDLNVVPGVALSSNYLNMTALFHF